MTSWRHRSRKPPAAARSRRRSGRPSQYETVTDEAALDRWIAEARQPGLCRDRYRDRLHRLHRRQAGRDQPGDRAQQGLLHPGRPWRRRSLFGSAEPAADASWCWRKLKPLLEDPAVLKIGHNLKYDWVMFDKAGIDVAPL